MTIFTQAEIARQRVELSSLRNKHATEIVMSGLADRMIAATGPANETVLRTPLNEGSELTPERYLLAALDDSFYDRVHRDLELAHARSGGEKMDELTLSKRLVQVSSLPSVGLAITRYDTAATVKHRIGCRYTIGCNLLKGWRLPLDGMAVDDVAMLENQLGEVDQLRVSKELTMLDPFTLQQRNPLVVRVDGSC